MDALLRAGGLRDALSVAGAKVALSAAVLASGFRAVSDDDYARVVITQGWAHAPKLDPTGTSWLPMPFWLGGSVMLAAGRGLWVARATAFVLGVGAVLLCWLAARWLWGEPDGERRGPLFAALAAAALPSSALLGVATVPELPTAALVVLAMASLVPPVSRGASVSASEGLRASEPPGAAERVDRSAPPAASSTLVRRRALGAACLLLACLSRYEAWPVAVVFAGLCAFDARPWRRPPSDAARLPIAAATGSIALALAGPVAWVLWNRHAHGDYLHFAARVAAYRDALVGGPGPGTLRSLGEYLGATWRAEPHLLAFTAVWLLLLIIPATRAPAAMGAVRRAARPLLLAGVILISLAWAGGRSGAPTHHPERALLAALLVLAMLGAVVALRVFRQARATGTQWLPAVAFAAALGTGLWVMRFYPGESLLHRQAEVAIGRAAAAAVPAGDKVLLQVEDYGYLAVVAATGRPEDVVPDRSPDPRLERAPSSFRSADALRARAAAVGARAVVARTDAPAANELGAPLATIDEWGVWRVDVAAVANRDRLGGMHVHAGPREAEARRRPARLARTPALPHPTPARLCTPDRLTPAVGRSTSGALSRNKNRRNAS